MAFVAPVPLSTSTSSVCWRSNFLSQAAATLGTKRNLFYSIRLCASTAALQDAPPSQVGAPEVPPSTKRVAGPSSDVFQHGASVNFWKHFQPGTTASRRNLAAGLRSTASEMLRLGPDGAAYMVHCAGRVAFFSLLLMGSSAARGQASNAKEGLTMGPFGKWMSKATLDNVEETGYVLLEDWRRVLNRVHSVPWDARVGSGLPAPGTGLRQVARAASLYRNISEKLLEEHADISVWLEGNMYPEYYRQTYHFQQDGWMSSDSAELYDLSTEVLFAGKQDGMQRMTLGAISEYLGSTAVWGVRTPKVVEMAAGTGRFATFVRDNFPQIDYTVSELSPFYLEKARSAMGTWETATRPSRGRKGATVGRTRFVQARAEDLPVASESVDVVFAVYLFHELPPHARREAVREAGRVLKVGGLFVITDSIQRGDRPSSDFMLDLFESFNEPWYGSYVGEDFAGMAEAEGFAAGKLELSSVSRMMSFIKK